MIILDIIKYVLSVIYNLINSKSMRMQPSTLHKHFDPGHF